MFLDRQTGILFIGHGSQEMECHQCPLRPVTCSCLCPVPFQRVIRDNSVQRMHVRESTAIPTVISLSQPALKSLLVLKDKSP